MPVNSEHPEYTDYHGRWVIVKDVIRSNVKQYIKDVEDLSTITTYRAAQDDNLDQAPGMRRYDGAKIYQMACNRNIRYRDDAQFVNFTGRTKNGLIGAIFRKDLVAELPASIEYLVNDATGTNVTLNRLAQEIAGKVLESGRYGLLVDHPASEEGLTKQQSDELELKARICCYEASSIINWSTSKEYGVPELTLVVLKEECEDIGDDGFEWVNTTKYRVLRLIDGVYVQEIYDHKLDFVRAYTPRDFDGNPLYEIPFIFVGSENNNPKVDSIPLYDLAMLNIGHLRNSADYEEAVFICGQPTLMISTDMPPDLFYEYNPDGIKVGARRGHNLGPGGSAQFLQAAPNNLPDEAMKRKEEQMAMSNARIITKGGTNETAEGVRMRLSGETSELTIIALNVQEAIIDCCNYATLFMGGANDQEDMKVEINLDFFEQNIDPQEMGQLLMYVNNGIITKDDVRNKLRKVGFIDSQRTNEEIEAEVQAQVIQANPLAVY